jgi:hypothetical protein
MRSPTHRLSQPITSPKTLGAQRRSCHCDHPQVPSNEYPSLRSRQFFLRILSTDELQLQNAASAAFRPFPNVSSLLRFSSSLKQCLQCAFNGLDSPQTPLHALGRGPVTLNAAVRSGLISVVSIVLTLPLLIYLRIVD